MAGENDSNTPRVDAYYFENGEKNLRVQKYPDTCGQGGVRSGDAKAARTSKKKNNKFNKQNNNFARAKLKELTLDTVLRRVRLHLTK